MFKLVLLVCAQVLFIQSIAGQCMGRYSMGPRAADAFSIPVPVGSSGCGVAAIPASSGGGLEISSTSSISPNGFSVTSENAIEGNLAVVGALPFLGAVALEGVLPTTGVGSVNYGCGNGEVAIMSENNAPTGIAGSLGSGAFGYGFGPRAAANSIGYGTMSHGLSSRSGSYHTGCGCGATI
ncbi:unnamed protein product [Euphydryas editha]|uniref:Uncharacterized protein n=1 Tax=Euphydryas editha TaxID=104508 RepID=A0AAU9TDG2_EUPED|nr:unnamed protein product [Euphydryas editha]